MQCWDDFVVNLVMLLCMGPLILLMIFPATRPCSDLLLANKIENIDGTRIVLQLHTGM